MEQIRGPPISPQKQTGAFKMPPPRAGVVEWNTQRSLKPPSSRGNCGFKSHRPHHYFTSAACRDSAGAGSAVMIPLSSQSVLHR